MKSLRSFWFSIAIVILSTAFVADAENAFRVSGYGKVFYTPDRFDLSFAVVTENADISRCKEQHLAIVTKVKAFLDEQQKAMVSLRQDATTLERTYVPNSQRVFRYTTSFSARLREASTLMPFQEGIVTAGVTDLHGLDLFSTRQTELIDEARREAIKDAKKKAELAARELGWKSLNATDITFTEESWRKNLASVNYGSRISVAKPESPADLTTYVDCGVSITFRFQLAEP